MTLSRFDQYLADELFFDEVWFDQNYDAVFTDLLNDGYSREEAMELAIEELSDKWREERCWN